MGTVLYRVCVRDVFSGVFCWLLTRDGGMAENGLFTGVCGGVRFGSLHESVWCGFLFGALFGRAWR
jgi:hypothetical protein